MRFYQIFMGRKKQKAKRALATAKPRAKRARKGSLPADHPGSGSGPASSGPGSGIGSGGPIVSPTDPYGLLGTTVMVPGMWWKGESEKKKKFLCDIISCELEHQFGSCKGIAYFIRARGPREPLCEISLQNLCVFLPASRRPAGWNDHEADVEEQTESSDAPDTDSDVSDQEDGTKSKGKEPKKAAQKKQTYAKKPKGKYEVASDELPAAQKSVREAVEDLAGKRKVGDSSNWENPPKGWHKKPEEQSTTNATRMLRKNQFSGEGFKLKKLYTVKQAEEWTELDSFYACHPEAAIDIAVRRRGS